MTIRRFTNVRIVLLCESLYIRLIFLFKKQSLILLTSEFQVNTCSSKKLYKNLLQCEGSWLVEGSSVWFQIWFPHFRLIPEKPKLAKKLQTRPFQCFFLALFALNWTNKNFSQKIGLCQFLALIKSYIHANIQKKLISHF